MTLKTDLAGALAPVLGFLTDELGETGRLRRRNEDEAEDGSGTSTLDRVPGAPEPIGILPVSRGAEKRAEDWGREQSIELEAYIVDTIPVKEGDLVRLMSGTFEGKWVEAWRSRREPAGGVNLWAFIDAGDAEKLEALDQGF